MKPRAQIDKACKDMQFGNMLNSLKEWKRVIIASMVIGETGYLLSNGVLSEQGFIAIIASIVGFYFGSHKNGQKA
ncbi:MAG: hypothetical protein GY782_08515 [Gammaproteobacteria bacterium]|nr:hypothetical protein [Gammaproteobacteria bacterium]